MKTDKELIEGLNNVLTQLEKSSLPISTKMPGQPPVPKFVQIQHNAGSLCLDLDRLIHFNVSSSRLDNGLILSTFILHFSDNSDCDFIVEDTADERPLANKAFETLTNVTR